MILNEAQILERLVDPDPERRIIITPLLKPEEQFGPTSVDLRLGTDFQVMARTNITHMDLMKDPDALSRDVQKHMQHVKVKPTEPFILHPGEFALASTLEFVKVPLDLAARLEGRSTWGRLGLQIHATAGFVDPGFRGALTFELSNVSNIPLPLYPGVRISQICFFLSSTTHLPYGKKRFTKYSGKTSTASSAFFKDPEYSRIREAQKQHSYR
ncbi:dCTP deaminase [Vampirovibrio chlorellavorus]|uniref:dCTP deaminase n=1 Tax=Vampirovibrio chlorellavorus TaxID=758823 RepID=UPI0026E9431B|nr:dCTP deaminase [Vampirovibrio chlorellavorus]